MAGLARNAVARLGRLAMLCVRTPHYILGRFSVVRSVHKRVRRLRHPPASATYLMVGDLYGPTFTPEPIAPSGHVQADRSTGEYVAALRVRSHSLGLTLTPEAVSSMQALARTLPLAVKNRSLADYGTIVSSPRFLNDAAIGTVARSCEIPLVRRVAADATLVEIASAALGYHPKSVSSWLFWSFANALDNAAREDRNQTVMFHYDVDGYNFYYVSFYLLPTDERTGAHVLVEGSHRGKRLGHLFGSTRLDDREIARIYSAERIVAMTGPAGTGFIEDASCYHKALPPLDRERLMLQLRYQ